MSPQLTKKISTKKESNQYDRIILDLKIKGLSLNEIRNHLLLCHKKNVSIRRIRQSIIQSGKKAKKINQFYDKKILPKIQIAEADEIYQGRDGMYVGIVDKDSTYLLSLKQLKSKNTENFQEYFLQFKESLTSLLLWITDGLSTYNPSLNSTYPDVVHLICHVHTYRDVMEEQEVYNRKARRKYKKLSKARKKLAKAKQHLIHNQEVVRTSLDYLNLLVTDRDIFYLKHDIKKRSNAKRFRKQREKFKKKIGRQRAYARAYKKQVVHWEKKINLLQKEMIDLDAQFYETKVVALQTGRLVKEFKDLLDCKWNEFKPKEERLMNLYSNSAYPIAKKLLKMIKNKKKVFNDKDEIIQSLVAPNRANTNTIESIFGRYRLFFKKYRKMKDTKYSNAVFEILRLHHNLSPPYTGPNKQISPIMRVGVSTKYRNCLDRLCGAIS